MAADRHQAQAYPLRLPEDLKARVTAAASEQGRSLNSELIARLEASFAPDAEAALLRQDAETLRQALESVHRMASITSVMPTLMAKLFRDVLDQIPAKVVSEIAGVDEARALANAMLHDDPHAMFESLAALLLPSAEIEPTRQLVQADIRAADAAGLKRRKLSQDVAELKQEISGHLTDAKIIRREPKQPVLTQGPRKK